MVNLARGELSLDTGKWNQDPYLLNVANGTLDLRTGKLRAHSRQDLLTKVAPVEFIEGAQCPRWLSFLSRVLGEDHRAHGGHGETVMATDEFAPAFERAVASGKPAIIDVKIDREAISTSATLSGIRGKGHR